MGISFLPNWLFEPFVVDARIREHLSYFLSSAAIVGGVLLLGFVDVGHVPHVCLFKLIFRVPCPGCGIIRSLSAFSRGDLLLAWHANPVGPALAVYIVSQMPGRAAAILCLRTESFAGKYSLYGGKTLTIGLVVMWLLRIAPMGR
jgi:hypothetical protein